MTMSLEFWLEFFESAGFNRDQAVQYANIFCVNRIQLEHLPSFDREILREMNITAMGDIVTILTYIKKICGVVGTSRSLPVIETPVYYQSAHIPNIEDYRSKDNFVSSNQHSNIINPKTPPSENPVIQRISPLMCGSQQLPSQILRTQCLSSSKLPETTDRPLQRTPASAFLTAPVVPRATSSATSSSSTEDGVLEEQCNPQTVVRPNCETNERYCYSPAYTTENYDRSEERAHDDSVTPAKVVTNGDLSDLEVSSDCYTFDSEDSEFQQTTPSTLLNNNSEDSEFQQTTPSTLLNNNNTFQLNNLNPAEETLHYNPTSTSFNCKIQDDDLTSEAASDEGPNPDYSEDLITTEASEGPHRRRSVFERLGRRPFMNKIPPKWRKPVLSKLRGRQIPGKRWLNGGNTLHRNSQKPNGLINRNCSIKNRLGRIAPYGQNNKYSTEKVAPSVKGHAPVENNYSDIPSEICNGNANPESTEICNGDASPESTEICNGDASPEFSDSDEIHPELNDDGDDEKEDDDEEEILSNSTDNSELFTCFSTGIIGPESPEEDRNCVYFEDDSQESYTSKVEDNEPSTLQRVVPCVYIKDGKFPADAGIEKCPHQDMHPEGSTLGSATRSLTQSLYSSPQQSEEELEDLKDPTCTNHSENYFLAWVHRRKHAHSFRGARPSFL